MTNATTKKIIIIFKLDENFTKKIQINLVVSNFLGGPTKLVIQKSSGADIGGCQNKRNVYGKEK